MILKEIIVADKEFMLPKNIIILSAVLGVIYSILCMAGCGSGTTEDQDVISGTPCSLGEPAEEFVYPEAPYGVEIGDRFQDFSMKDCDGANVSFSDLLSRSEMVLINVAAGWCTNCIAETPELEKEFAQGFCSRELAVIQILFEDEDLLPADAGFCANWRDRFKVTYPVVIDPDFTIGIYGDSDQMPLNIVVDKEGIIQYKAVGSNLGDLHQRMNEWLPAE